MKFLIKIIFNKNAIPLILVIVFSLLAARSLVFQKGYFIMHDDLQMMRQLEMEKCFTDGQIPCRWIPDMGYGFGFPLFNFYPPLPYLIGEIFRILGLSFITTVKLTFALSILGSGIGMYLLAKEFFGRIGGVLSSIFYIWAPYHAVDVYVRGAMNEAWALVFFPLIFWSSYKLIYCKKEKEFKWIVGLAVFYSLLFMSHNLMLLIFTPFFGLWLLIHLWKSRNWKKIVKLLISGIWALGLAAFFTLPALAENKFTQVKTQLMGYYDYTAHFASIKQLLFSRYWGYGPSVWGAEEDGMSFQIGIIHWILSIIVGIGLLIRFLIKKENLINKLKNDEIFLIGSFLFLTGWFSAFMTHLRSIFIYQAIPQLSYVQFPWRFLAITIFSFSFLIGFIPGFVARWKSKHGFLIKLFLTPPQILISVFLILLIIILNWKYFEPFSGAMRPLTDTQKFSGAAWELQQTAGIYDYLPITANTAPKSPKTIGAEVMNGEADIREYKEGTYWAIFKTVVKSNEAYIRINILDFPGWRIFIDESEVEKFKPKYEEWGRIWLKVSNGEHLVYAQFMNTPIRTFANLISIISWSLVVILPISKKRFNTQI